MNEQDQHHSRPEYARIPLQRRDGTVIAFALVDTELQAWASQWTWRLSSDGYAVRSETRNAKKRTIRMHRVINQTPPGMVTDHINGDKLDNRRANLRTATAGQNNANSADRARRSSYRGVYWHNQAQKWYAQISVGGELHHLGLFELACEAAQAYDEAARSIHGDFARLNLARAR